MEHTFGRIPPSPTHDYFSTTGVNVRRHHPLLNSPESLHHPAATAYSQQAALEESLARLSLGGSTYGHWQVQPLRPVNLDADPIVGGEGFPAANGSLLESYNTRLVNPVNGGQSLMGFGVGPVNPNVDQLGNRTSSAQSPWYWPWDDIVPLQQSSHEFDHNIDHHQLHSYFLRKKQLFNQLNSQPQTFPSPNASQFDSFLNGFGPNPTHNINNLRPDLSSHLLPPESAHFLNLEGFRGRIVEFAKDQIWCRILQLKFANPSQEEIEMVLSEVIDHVGDLLTDQFGNYIIQKLVAVCNDEQRTRIIRSMCMTPFQLIIICKNPHGAKAVQNLLDCLTHPYQVALLIAALSPGAAALAKDLHGHHVIQYCLIHFSHSCNQHILEEITDHCFEIAISKTGCCVLQTCVQNSQGESRHHLVSQILANAIHLAVDPYGNYVLQHMLGLGVPDIKKVLLRQLEGNYVSLACNKYASNVVERCLVESEEEQSTRIIMELVRSPNSPMLLLDPYGNFVIQSALTVSKGLARNSLLNLVQKNVPLMRSNQYGKKILSWFDKRNLQQLHN